MLKDIMTGRKGTSLIPNTVKLSLLGRWAKPRPWYKDVGQMCTLYFKIYMDCWSSQPCVGLTQTVPTKGWKTKLSRMSLDDVAPRFPFTGTVVAWQCPMVLSDCLPRLVWNSSLANNLQVSCTEPRTLWDELEKQLCTRLFNKQCLNSLTFLWPNGHTATLQNLVKSFPRKLEVIITANRGLKPEWNVLQAHLGMID